MLSVYNVQVVFQEIPDNISLSFSICGCGGRCKNCHSPFLHDRSNGELMSLSHFKEVISKYTDSIDTILFLGGEWEEDFDLYIKHAQLLGFKTALYTNLELEDVPSPLTAHLDYLKVGSYIEELGGLDNPKTNQKLYHIHHHSGTIYFEDITYKFQKVVEM